MVIRQWPGDQLFVEAEGINFWRVVQAGYNSPIKVITPIDLHNEQ